MYARVTRIKSDPARLDETVAQLREQLVPIFKQQKGYLGAVSIANRENGEGATTTYWDSLDNLKASEATIFAARDKFAQEQSAQIVSFHRCEVAVQERVKAPEAGVAVRANIFTGIASDRIEESIARFKDSALPKISGQPGFRGALLLVDRENGVAFATSSWDSEAEREATLGLTSGDRDSVTERGASLEIQNGEVTFAELTVPAQTT